ncbi:MAG: SulP family inorganic anion transporter [Gallionellaceae bacterium]|nr:SulP family inorganic anion transporter [Gallionellaceae bacterium]MDD5366601.1 SulP family inorganic anion transporter [Gallionellaceae bacterium]
MSATSLKQRFPLDHLSGDVWGGLAAMLVALPSAIAFGVAIYSPLGGSLSAQGALAGILGATALGLVAPVFGGRPRLITAPCAPAAAVLSALAIGFAQQGLPAATALLLLALIGLLAGGIQIGLGLAGIGRLIRFIPFPVVSGYLSGVGLIIIGSQIPKFLGAPNGTRLLDAVATPAGWNWHSLLIGAVVLATMLLTPRVTRAVPAAIVALLAGAAGYLGLAQLDPALMTTDHNPLLVGTLVSAEGSLTDNLSQHWLALSGLGLGAVTGVIVPALTLAVLLSIDTLKTCLVIDTLTNSQHDSNRELLGQGLGNIASALVGGIPGSGTMGPSAINISSGGATRLSGLMAGVFSLATFLLLAPLIAWIPVAALAAIMIVVGFRMIDQHSLAFFFTRSTRLDFVVILAVILVALFGDLIAASGVGVALAMLLFIREQTRSSVVRTRIEGQEIFTRRAHSPQDLELLEQEGNETVVFELQGSLFFGTASQLHAALDPETGNRKYVILSMRRVQSLDVTATHVLEQIKSQLEEHDAYLVFCDIPKGLPSGLKMKRFLKETGIVRPTEKALAFRQLDDALEWIAMREVANCPIGEICPATIDLRAMPALKDCSEEALAALAAAVELRTVKAGKRVFKVGHTGKELFLIRSGLVKITLPIHKKDNYHLATSGPGEIVGGMSFIEGSGHSADAVAMTDTEVYALSHESFDALAAGHPGLALALAKYMALTLSARLHAAIRELEALRG